MKKKYNTINFKILLPIMIVILLEAFIVIIIFYASARKTLDSSLIDGFKGSVDLRKNYVETLMLNKWSNLDGEYNSIYSSTEAYLKSKGITITELLNNEEYSEELIYEQRDILPSILGNNDVTNCYLILNNSSKTSIFLSTKNPDKAMNYEIDVDHAPFDIVQYYQRLEYGIDSTVYDDIFDNIENQDFYQKPIEFATQNINYSAKNCSYWSSDLNFDKKDLITYSLPIIYNNVVVGILGVGLSTQYLQVLMNHFSNENNLNIAIIREKNNKKEVSFKSSNDYSLDNLTYVNINKTKYNKVFSYENDIENKTEYLCYDSINIDTDNEYGEAWYILGVQDKALLFETSNRASTEVLITISLGSLITFFVLFFITLLISKPIIRVSKEIDENNITNIPKTNIYEVDVILQRLQQYFSKSLEYNRKINKIINDSNTDIGIAELLKDENVVTTTPKFYKMLGLDYPEETVGFNEFYRRIQCRRNNFISSSLEYDDIDEVLYSKSGDYMMQVNDRYLRLKTEVTDSGIIASLVDLTVEYMERKRIEHERDFDILTGLLNRRGLANTINKIRSKGVKKAALYMIDIDNLKKFNDDYGHDFGDKYIKTVGDYFIEMQNKYNSLICGHISGDEFLLYLNNPEDDNLIYEIADDIKNIKNEYVECYSKKNYVSLSCGIAIQESEMNYEELRKRADFAMYSVKKTQKNSVGYFDEASYELYINEENMYMNLNKLINERLIDYAYQPIINVNTGEVLGYEALMRPKLKEYKNPITVIEYAKKYSKLYDIEYLTVFMATEKFYNSKCDKKLFINSISSQILSDEKYKEYFDKYKELINNIVIEIIEEDFAEQAFITKKTNFLKSEGINYAIDDYGTGFNNIGMILDLSPKYIKIEGSLISGIDKDEKKMQFTKSIVNFCKINNILVIAESVETIEELKRVKEIGVDYIQGYIASKPELEIKDISQEIKELVKNA